MRLLGLVLVLGLTTLGACGGDDDSNSNIDAASGPACTGAVYDTCSGNAQCTSQNCHLFMADGIQVCTQACSAGVACPNDSAGAAVACNGMGICKPSVANNCHR
jgi:hypothetical protein